MHLLNPHPPQHCRWHIFNTTAELEQAATHAILQAAQKAISLRGAFHIVLAGGTTPRRIYESLRNADADWAAWHVYFGDERCLPADDVERNSMMAAQAWLNHVAIPLTQIHFIPTEKGAQTAARAYTQTLVGIELFDFVLLGLGEDGHTASLFPDHELGNMANPPTVIVVENAPKYPPQRISLSAHRLSAARKVIFIVSGAKKQQAVKDWRNGVAIPAATISPTSGVDVYLEAALVAAEKLN
jgi:6-phosphogluconolactonase